MTEKLRHLSEAEYLALTLEQRLEYILRLQEELRADLAKTRAQVEATSRKSKGE